MELAIKGISYTKESMRLLFLLLFSFVRNVAYEQDSSYAKHVELAFNDRVDEIQTKRKRLSINGQQLDVRFYKNSKQARTIISWKEPTNHDRVVLFFYLNDSLAMVSPAGQQPYYIRNGIVAFGAERKHSNSELTSLIQKGSFYLERWNVLRKP
ncbi:MAG: hypothetical protein EOO15_21830 [Chitinophagaceae bacterium]|nr:MAG: hypothetical protein EOO15_21830 [Chitinophagaceae bacterium]